MGAKKSDITEVAPAILRKMGSISPCFTHKDTNGPKNSSQYILSHKFFPQIIDIEWVQKNLDIMAPAILRKMGSILPCFTHKDTPGPTKSFPNKVFPKSSSPNMINIEWVQINLDIMAPAILRKMGSISPCFTHKDTNGPKNYSPKNSFPKVLPPKLLTSNGCK